MKRIGFALLAVVCALPLAAQQQAAPPPQKGQGTVIVKNVNIVPLVFVAQDKHHHFVPGLTADQIQVYDNGQLQHVQKFDAEGNLPLRIVLLIDISKSINSRWSFEQKAAIDFLASVLVEGRDRAMVAGFDTSLHVAQPFTDKFEALSAAIKNLRPSGGTALYDAVFYTSHDDLGAGSVGNGEVRNVIVVISDGNDNQSRYSRGEAIAMAQDTGAVIYTIGTESTGVNGDADNVLKKFASETGGRSYFPIEARDLSGAFSDILNDLRHQYVVSYNPNNFVPNGEFHTVEVKIKTKGVTARTRKGYFARADH